MERKRILEVEDAAYCEVLVNKANEVDLRSTFEKRYGHGWQRKLSEVLGIPETTVNGWFRSGKIPVLARLALGIFLSRPLAPPQEWIAVENGARYAVCDTQKPLGRIVADNISNLNDAVLVAAAPQLQAAALDAYNILINTTAEEAVQEALQKLDAALTEASAE